MCVNLCQVVIWFQYVLYMVLNRCFPICVMPELFFIVLIMKFPKKTERTDGLMQCNPTPREKTNAHM